MTDPSLIRYHLGDRSGVPLHRKAERFLRSLIESKKFAEGKLLPPEVSLARRLGVSRGTMRVAIQRIVQDGLLERKTGVGTRVTKRKLFSGAGAWGSFTREMARRGIVVENFSESKQMVHPPAAVARELRIGREKQVLLLDRVRGCDGVPIGHFRSYFSPRLGLDMSLAINRPLYELIEEKCSIVADRSDEELTGVVANSRLAEALRVPLRHPLLRRVRTVYDTASQPIEYAIIHYRSDHFALTLKLTKEPS